MNSDTISNGIDFSFPLFVPANRPERISKAWAAGTDAIIIDLEDAVAEADKDQARLKVKAVIDEQHQTGSGDVATYLRINASNTRYYEDDLKLLTSLDIDGVVLPKSESADTLLSLRQALKPEQKILALIETAIGVGNVRALASECDRLVFGSIDYCSDLNMAHSQTTLLHARAEIVLAARLAKIAAPLDGVTTATNDATLIQADASHSSELGFGGKLLIHPAQIDPARRGFAPPAEDVTWAQRVIDAAQTGGAMSIDGAMVDAPVIARAQSILIRLEKLR